MPQFRLSRLSRNPRMSVPPEDRPFNAVNSRPSSPSGPIRLPAASTQDGEASSTQTRVDQQPTVDNSASPQAPVGETPTMDTVESSTLSKTGRLPITSTEGIKASRPRADKSTMTDASTLPPASIDQHPTVESSANPQAPVGQATTMDTSGSSSLPEHLSTAPVQASQTSIIPTPNLLSQVDGPPTTEPEHTINKNNVVIKRTKKKGWGLFARRRFAGGDTILHEPYLIKNSIYPDEGWKREVRIDYRSATHEQKKTFRGLSKCGRRASRSIYARFISNAVDLRKQNGGHRVYEWASRINHSCKLSNCVRTYNSVDGSITVKALTVIEEGQELLFNYFPEATANRESIPTAPLWCTFDCHCNHHGTDRLEPPKDWLRCLRKVFCVWPSLGRERMDLSSSDASGVQSPKVTEVNLTSTEYGKGSENEADNGADSGYANEPANETTTEHAEEPTNEHATIIPGRSRSSNVNSIPEDFPAASI